MSGLTDYGMQYADALPSWTTLVVSRTERNSLGISYEVHLQNEAAAVEDELGDGRSAMVWHVDVFFGQTDSHCAGGYAFREAAREQDRIAERFAALLRNPKPAPRRGDKETP